MVFSTHPESIRCHSATDHTIRQKNEQLNAMGILETMPEAGERRVKEKRM